MPTPKLEESRINKLLSENEGGQHCEDKTNTFTLSHGERHQTQQLPLQDRIEDVWLIGAQLQK